MPKQPVTDPAHIYWLIDKTTGLPIYCGKTNRNPSDRLREHFYQARCHPHRKLSAFLLTTTIEDVEIRVMKTVPAGQDWCEQERRWIRQIKICNPSAFNTAPGGEGFAGRIHSAEARARMSASQKGRPKSPQARMKISAGLYRYHAIAKREFNDVTKRALEKVHRQFCEEEWAHIVQSGAKITKRDFIRLRTQTVKNKADRLRVYHLSRDVSLRKSYRRLILL